MAIRIIEEPDVYLTADEVARYRREYEQAYSMYCGTPPTFESYCRHGNAVSGISSITMGLPQLLGSMLYRKRRN